MKAEPQGDGRRETGGGRREAGAEKGEAAVVARLRALCDGPRDGAQRGGQGTVAAKAVATKAVATKAPTEALSTTADPAKTGGDRLTRAPDRR